MVIFVHCCHADLNNNKKHYIAVYFLNACYRSYRKQFIQACFVFVFKHFNLVIFNQNSNKNNRLFSDDVSRTSPITESA